MIVLDVDNIKLPSINQKFGGINPKTGKMFIAGGYKQMSGMMIDLMRAYNNIGSIPAPYSVKIEVETYLDIDNYIKCVIDSLARNHIIGDDKDVLHLEVHKKYRKKGGGSRIKVEVTTCTQ